MAIGNFTEVTWASALLARLGIPITNSNMQAIVGWERAEGGHWHNSARYNPLNTTQPMPGAGNTGTQGNIKVYTSWSQGLDATVKTLRNGHYPAILQSLRNGSPSSVASAIGASPWGTGGGLTAQTIAAAPKNLAAGVSATGNVGSTSGSLTQNLGTAGAALGGVVGATGALGGPGLSGLGGNATNAVGGAVSSTLDWASALGTLLSKLLDPSWWLHALEVVGGVILIGMGLHSLGVGPSGTTVSKLATSISEA